MQQDELELLRTVVGETCWHVSVGGVTSPSFLLAFGGKMPRERSLRNPAQPQSFRENRGARELLVWCSWRVLDSAGEPTGTSAQGEAGEPSLRQLVAKTVKKVDCRPPVWDLDIAFDDGHLLSLFCDHLEPGTSIPQNWEFWSDESHLSAGPGSFWSRSIEPREPAP